MECYGGVDAGSTYIKAAIVDANGGNRTRKRFRA